ncbi:hypothetical protein SAY87_026930 [Trapa incisa]|uniref:Uncharacterized protein n=1 Tax=Trapa incisa TaxID=236973 RepID=A0AAN7JEI3_9MYRT|nr:hypothetical protein SAY87_026930 [Trapa incisa]
MEAAATTRTAQEIFFIYIRKMREDVLLLPLVVVYLPPCGWKDGCLRVYIGGGGGGDRPFLDKYMPRKTTPRTADLQRCIHRTCLVPRHLRVFVVRFLCCLGRTFWLVDHFIMGMTRSRRASSFPEGERKRESSVHPLIHQTNPTKAQWA